MHTENTDLKKSIRDVPDFPKKGIVFKDITRLLADQELFKKTINSISERYKSRKINKIVGMESRGFIFGAPVAYSLGAGFVPVRKKGKLPYKTISTTYQLEYGTDTLEMHADAIKSGENILIVDDVLATGGTAAATVDLVKKSGGNIIGLAFLIELSFLNGREKIKGHEVFSLLTF